MLLRNPFFAAHADPPFTPTRRGAGDGVRGATGGGGGGGGGATSAGYANCATRAWPGRARPRRRRGARAARREARREERAEVCKEARALAAARRGAAVEAGLPPPELVDERALAVALVRVELGVAREVRQEPRGRGGRRAARVLGARAVGGRARDAAEAVQVVEARLLGERGLLVRVRLAPEAPHVGLGGRRDGVVRAALGLERARARGEAGARLAQGRDARRELGLARAERPAPRARARPAAASSSPALAASLASCRPAAAARARARAR